MGIFWTKFNCSFTGEYRDKKSVDIYYEFEVKRNLTYLFTDDIILKSTINRCIQEFLSIFIEKKWMYEGENINRLIREDRLKIINSHINTNFQFDWCPKGLKVRNIKITHLI